MILIALGGVPAAAKNWIDHTLLFQIFKHLFRMVVPILAISRRGLVAVICVEHCPTSPPADSEDSLAKMALYYTRSETRF